MRIAIAQTKSIKGEINSNIAQHATLLESIFSSERKIDLVIFPELSITGYEPQIASEIAMRVDDNRLDIFQNYSDKFNTVIGVGVPIIQNDGVAIGLLLFKPNDARNLYCKQYLHEDELPYFTAGLGENNFLFDKQVALAICYEIMIPEHLEKIVKENSAIYVASVSKHKKGVDEATRQLTHLAKKYHMTVLMANNVGTSDDFIAAGNSMVINKYGEIVTTLNDSEIGFLIQKI